MAVELGQPHKQTGERDLDMDERSLKEKISEYKFYHVIELTEKVSTPGEPRYVPAQQMVLNVLRSLDLDGKRVLDVGCRDGLFSFECEKLGSSEVIGIDNDISKPAVEFLIPYFNSNVKMHEMNLFDLKPSTFGKFDIIVFSGVLYHLRLPFYALKILRDLLSENGIIVIETAIWSGNENHAMLYCPIGLESPYEPTSCTFFNEKGMKDSLYSLGMDVESVKYLKKKIFRKKAINQLKCMARIKPIYWFLHHKIHGTERRKLGNINRAIFVCRAFKSNLNRNNWGLDVSVDAYWHGTHDFHTRKGGG